MKKLIAGLLLMLSPFASNAAVISASFELFSDPLHTVAQETFLSGSTVFGLAEVSIVADPLAGEVDAGLNRVAWDSVLVGPPANVTLVSSVGVPQSGVLALDPPATQVANPVVPGASTLSVAIAFSSSVISVDDFLHDIIANLLIDYTSVFIVTGPGGGDLRSPVPTLNEQLQLVDTMKVPVPPSLFLIGGVLLALSGVRRLKR